MIKFEFNNDIAIIIGWNGSGKTTLIKNIITNIPIANVRILDTQAEFINIQKYANVSKIPLNYDKQTLESFLTECEAIGNVCAVINDFDVYPINNSHKFKNLIIGIRHKKLGLLVNGKRALGIPKVILQNAKYVIFNTHIPKEDMKYLIESLGIDVPLRKLKQYYFYVFDNKSGKISIIKTVKV